MTLNEQSPSLTSSFCSSTPQNPFHHHHPSTEPINSINSINSTNSINPPTQSPSSLSSFPSLLTTPSPSPPHHNPLLSPIRISPFSAIRQEWGEWTDWKRIETSWSWQEPVLPSSLQFSQPSNSNSNSNSHSHSQINSQQWLSSLPPPPPSSSLPLPPSLPSTSLSRNNIYQFSSQEDDLGEIDRLLERLEEFSGPPVTERDEQENDLPIPEINIAYPLHFPEFEMYP